MKGHNIWSNITKILQRFKQIDSDILKWFWESLERSRTQRWELFGRSSYKWWTLYGNGNMDTISYYQNMTLPEVFSAPKPLFSINEHLHFEGRKLPLLKMKW